MSDLRTSLPKPDRTFLAQSRHRVSEDLKQRKLMIGSLCLLLVALGIVLWRDRDIFFPGDASDAESVQPTESAPATQASPPEPRTDTGRRSKAARTRRLRAAQSANLDSQPDPPPVSITSRTVLPPLDVEVVAGDTHHTIRPGNNSVRVDVQPDMPSQPAPEVALTPNASATGAQTAASLTSEAAERVQMSENTSSIVDRTVRPNYPTLARQMKVQGSVVLQALIGKDGVIQNLHVISGPHILASAAEDAVRQWHFKPHYQGIEPVETEARITVNFTISTN